MIFFFFASAPWGVGKVLLRSRKSKVCVDAASQDGWEWQGWIFPTLPRLQDTPGRSSHPPSLPGAVGKGVLDPLSHFVPEKKRIWEQLPQFQVHWAPSDLWLVNHCRVLAGITGVNKEHFCVQVWLSWKWELLSETGQPLLPFTWEFWGVDTDIFNGLGLMNTQLP